MIGSVFEGDTTTFLLHSMEEENPNPFNLYVKTAFGGLLAYPLLTPKFV